MWEKIDPRDTKIRNVTCVGNMENMCREHGEKTDNRLVETLNDWKEKVEGDDIMDKVENSLKGKPVII